jgi:Skp family chaperone for outer membrane proteins
VQRKLFTLAGIAALAVAAYVGSQLHAQPQYQQGNIQQAAATTTGAAGRTIGVVNLQAIIRKYQKWLDLEKIMKDGFAHYNTQFEQLRQRMIALKGELEKLPEGDPTRETKQGELKGLERQVEDLRETAKRQLGKYQDEQVVQIYREIQEAVTVCARARHIDMVLQYSDPTAPAEMYHPQIVANKMRSPWCMPMYVDPELDLTGTVTEMLNNRVGANTNPNGSR